MLSRALILTAMGGTAGAVLVGERKRSLRLDAAAAADHDRGKILDGSSR